MRHGQFGTVSWKVENNDLIFYPTNGRYGTLKRNEDLEPRWKGEYNTIKFKKGVKGGKHLRDLFAFCKADTIDLTNLNTSMTVSFHGIFRYTECNNLIIGDLDTHKVRSWNGAFCMCQIKKVDLSKCDLSATTYFNNAFDGSQIGELILPDNIPNLTSTTDAFYGCKIDRLVAGPDTFENVLYVSRMFKKANIKNLDIIKLNFPKVAIADYMFDCARILNTDYSNIHFSENIDLQWTFSNIITDKLVIGKMIKTGLNIWPNHIETFENINVNVLDLTNLDLSGASIKNIFSKAEIDELILKDQKQYNILKRNCSEIDL